MLPDTLVRHIRLQIMKAALSYRVGRGFVVMGIGLGVMTYAHAHGDVHTNPTVSTPIVFKPSKPSQSLEQSFWQSSQQSPVNLQNQSPAHFYDQYRHRQIALWSLRQINAHTPLLQDAWVEQVLHQMTARMNAQVRQQSLVATPIIVNNDINAFAVVGGVIGMNTGTILSATALDEVASVLAHEIAHLSQRHYEHRHDNRHKTLALQLGGLLAAIAVSSVSGDAAAAALIGTQTAGAEMNAAHSREHEHEADRVGQYILAQAGYDAHAMPRFFQQLSKQTQLNQSATAFVPSFIQTHPFTLQRLSESTSRAKQYPNVNMKDKQMQAMLFDKLYWRVKYLSKQASLADLAANAKHSQGAKLALALHLSHLSEHEQAMATFQEGGFDPEDELACITHGQILMNAKRHDQAVQVLTACQAIYPERRDLRIHLSQALIADDQAIKALALLTPLVDKTPHDLTAWQWIQAAYERQASGQTEPRLRDLSSVHALRARSQVQLWQANYHSALQSNAQALDIVSRHAAYASLKIMLDKDREYIEQARDFKI